MLRVTLVGNMGADPELRYSQKGTGIVSFTVAVNQVRKGPDGERQENTEWFRIRVAGPQTEFVQRLGKGTRVLLGIPRVECRACGVTRQVAVPFAAPKKHYTRSFERYALELSEHMTIQDVAEHLGVSWDTIKDIQKQDLQRQWRWRVRTGV